MLHDGIGFTLVDFDASGNVTGSIPVVPNITGHASMSNETMTFTVNGFQNPGGGIYSASFSGRRLSESEIASISLLSELDPAEEVVYSGTYLRSDMSGVPISLLVIKVGDK